MGFDALFFSRIDFEDIENRKKNKEMQMIWTPKTSQGNENDILVHITPEPYYGPVNYTFDIRDFTDFVVKDDPNLEDYNIDKIANDLDKKFTDKFCNVFKTNEIPELWGEDFAYSNAHMNFKNMDKVVKYFTEN